MELYLFLIIAIGCFSIVAKLAKVDWQKAERILFLTSLASFILLVLTIVLLTNNYRFKGVYTNSMIGCVFTISTLILFGVTRKVGTSIASAIFAVPIFIISALGLFVDGFKVLPYVLFMFFQPPLAKFTVNQAYNVEVRIGGFLACGESLTLTEKSYWLFDKQIYIGNSSCVHGINKVETIRFDKDSVEFLIYHDGKTEFDNPYNFKTAVIKNH